MGDNTQSKINNKICAVCEMSATKKCSACDNGYYCSRDHQKADWKFHSKICCPFKLMIDPTIGQRYVATRSIEIDELVLDEKPLLNLVPLEIITCLNCCVILEKGNAKECDKCGWHLCLDCTKHGPECEMTLKYRKSKVKIEKYDRGNFQRFRQTLGGPANFYSYAIIVMRALALRENDPVAYERFLRLKEHCIEEEIESRKYSQPSRNDVSKWIQHYINIKDVTEEEMTRIIGIARTNCKEISSPPKYARAVYDKASYFEHNCRANCLATSTKEGSLIIRAVMKIKKGDAISITYLNGLFMGTVDRRYLLKKMFLACSCERCKDPTEFGTMFNAVKCIKGKCTGYMLPPTFIESNDEKIPNFICDKCKATADSEILDILLEDKNEEYSIINKHSTMLLKKFIAKQSMCLHENHWMISRAEFDLAGAIFYADPSIASIETLKESVALGTKLSKLFETLMPEQYYSRGIILYHLYVSCIVLLHREKPIQAEFRRLAKEHKKFLEEACRFFRYEPLMDQELVETVRLMLDKANN